MICSDNKRVLIPASKRDMCKFPPFLSSRRSSASHCGLNRVMAVDGGLRGHNRLVLVLFSLENTEDQKNNNEMMRLDELPWFRN